MATIKSYTTIEQSRTLAEILPIESADYHYITQGEKSYFYPYSLSSDAIKDYDEEIKYIPCWSLAALLEQLPYEVVDDDGNSSYLQINKEDDVYQLVYTDPYGNFESIETDRYEHFVDACYEIIIRLNELNLL